MPRTPPGPAGRTTHGLRRHHEQLVLDAVWNEPSCTASELMAATGLTRATVLALCKGLAAQGWLVETTGRQERTKGRPALHYTLHERRTLVVGVDAGQHRIAATVADLRGHELGSASRRFEQDWTSWDTGQHRREEILHVIDQALTSAHLGPQDIGLVCLGVPAPVDAGGSSPAGHNAYWDLMNPQLTTLGAAHGWTCIVENDANLAALGEISQDPGLRNQSFATLLAGERYGSGLVLGGEVLRQARGGAGEMAVLDLVSGVGSTDGVAPRTLALARQALAAAREGSGAGTSLSKWTEGTVTVEGVFAEARGGDGVALGIVDQVLDQLARVCTVLVGPLDLDRVIVSGGIAPSLRGLEAQLQEKIGQYLYAPWLRIQVSAHGGETVRLGAVHRAVEEVRTRAVED